MVNSLSDAPRFPSRTELLLGRARRAQRRGERRQALVALREATVSAQSDPKLWALYGAACLKCNRLAEAERAFSQALFYRQGAHDTGRARTLRGVIERLASSWVVSEERVAIEWGTNTNERAGEAAACEPLAAQPRDF